MINVDALPGVADSGVFAEDLTDVLVAVGEAALKGETGLLLAIDEVQYLAAEELAALITAILCTTQLDLPAVLVGAGLPQLPGLAGNAKSYAERLFEFPVIGSLEQEDARCVPVHAGLRRVVAHLLPAGQDGPMECGHRGARWEPRVLK